MTASTRSAATGAKTKSIRETAAMIANGLGGEVPRTLEEMIKLKGVARKTASVVLGTAYGSPRASW